MFQARHDIVYVIFNMHHVLGSLNMQYCSVHLRRGFCTVVLHLYHTYQDFALIKSY